MKNNFLAILIIIPILFCTVSCLTKNKCEHNYHFEFPVTISPVLDTFYIGDTIWVSLIYDPKNLSDLNSNTNINVGDFNFNLEMGTLRIDSIDGFGINSFDIIQDLGNLLRVDLVDAVSSSIQFDMVIGEKTIRYGLVSKAAGIFTLGFNSLYETRDLGEQVSLTESNCNEFIEKIIFNTNNGATNNYLLYDSIVTEPPNNNISLATYNDGGVFTFIVKE